MDIEKLRQEITKKAELKYIKLARKNQIYYYKYKNLDIVLRVDITTDTAQYLSITKGGNNAIISHS